MTAKVEEGLLLWEPSSEWKQHSNIMRYMNWLSEKKALSFQDYRTLWEWSVSDLESFWASIWEFFDIQAEKPYFRVIDGKTMPGIKWFVGSELNYAEHIFRQMEPEKTAVIYASELRPQGEITWRELYEKVAALARNLKSLGIERGDRVVAYVPNIPEALIAFLACASIGAVWSSCSPDFGSSSVIDRFKQIQPKVLFAVDGFRFGGKDYNRLKTVEQIRSAIPSLKNVILISYLDKSNDGGVPGNFLNWEDMVKGNADIHHVFERVPFEHPLWIVYSSGTTGLPKAIVQGHGGILLEHLKVLSFHMDVKPGDRFFWFTTTGWMVWNVVVSGLLTGGTVILYDGSPKYPDLNVLWNLAESTGMTHFGTSAAFLTACMKEGLRPGNTFDLSRLKSVGSTGSPLPPEGFQWVYDYVKKDLWLVSASGGTDVCTPFVGGVPLLPVHAGEIQCRALGCLVEAFDDHGNSLIDEIGELVLTKPMPSMPLFFWNDPGGKRYRESYFDMYPNVWRHGDWIKITPRGSCIIYGRSDSTINRGGVRIGTSEIYSAAEKIPEVVDSLAVEVKKRDGRSFVPLFVILKENTSLDDELKEKIRRRIYEECSPRHVPDDIISVPDIPRTLNGKKLEVPVKKILMGVPVDKAVNRDSLANPESLHFFVEWAKNIRGV